MAGQDSRGFYTLLRDGLSDAGELARLDARMLRAEVKASLGQLVTCLVVASVALVSFVLAFATLWLAIYLALVAAGVPPVWSALILAVLGFAVALGAGLWVFGALRRWSIVPRRTFDQMRSNFSALKASFRDAA